MKRTGVKGYILLINLMLITLIGLIIPLIIQQQFINFRIINNRILLLKNKSVVESALDYQYYFLKEENSLINDFFQFNQEKIELTGKEENDYYFLKAEIDNEIPYTSEMTVEKENLKILKQITYRSD